MKKKKNLHLLSSMLTVTEEEALKAKKNSPKAQVYMHLVKEFETDDIEKLLVLVAYTYHPKFNKESVGPKEKWSSLLCAMLSVHLDYERNNGKKHKEAIHALEKDPLWSKMSKPIKDNYNTFDKPYRQGKLPINHHEYELALRLYSTPKWHILLRKEIMS